MKTRVIKVTLLGDWTPEEIQLTLESNFGGFGVTYQGDEERILYVKPHAATCDVFKRQLREMEKDGQLSFKEELA